MTQKVKTEQIFAGNAQNESILNKSSQIINTNWNAGHWSTQQNIKCIVFFQFNRQQLHSKLKMKENKFFKQMSMFIETRNPIQCRSQCHKLLRKHKTFYNAIAHFKEGFDLEEYDNIYKTYSKNDLIRFKGPQELSELEERTVISIQSGIQTQQSYLYKSYLKNITVRDNFINRLGEQNNYPFLRVGWWM